MKRIVGIGLTILVLSIFSSTVSAREDQPQCKDVGGTFIIDLVDDKTAVATLTGDLQGAVRGIVKETTPMANGVLNVKLEHTFVTGAGDLIKTSDEATWTPVVDKVFYMSEKQTIVGGSGQYANATGTLDEFGALDMASGHGVLRYSGSVCTG